MDFTKISQAAAKTENIAEVTGGGFTRTLPRAGVALLRLREYLELGEHDAKNPKYKPATKVLLIFELSHPDHMIEINGEKKPQSFFLRLNKTMSDKGKYKPAFDAMNAAHGGTAQTFADLVGKAFIGQITHSECGQYANLKGDGKDLLPPVQVDALTNTSTPVPVPELVGEPRVFFFENSAIPAEFIQEMWDSIYIEGTKDDGSSKNWIQDTIKSSNNWEGSLTQSIVEPKSGDLVDALGISDDDTAPF